MCWLSVVLSTDSRREYVSLPFSSSKGHLKSLICRPFLHSLSTSLKLLLLSSTFLCLPLIFLLSCYKDHCHYTGYSDHLKILNLIIHVEPLCHISYPQVLGIGMWTYLERHYSVYHRQFKQRSNAVVLKVWSLNRQYQHHLVEVQIVRPHYRPTESETL